METRRRKIRQTSLAASESPVEEISFSYEPSSRSTTPANAKDEKSASKTPAPFEPTMLDYVWPLSLVFGGCCTNAWAYEELLLINPSIGVTITFAQMAFITLQLLPSFVEYPSARQGSLVSMLPRLKPRRVPLRHWALQVTIFIAGALMNNKALAYRVPFTLQILFRSAGMAVAMLLNWLFLKAKYTPKQIGAVALISIGVILATLSKPGSPSKDHMHYSPQEYTLGIALLTIALFLTGFQGIFQFYVFEKYGPWWKEGMFYTHLMSLPIFVLYRQEIRSGLASLSKSPLGAIVPYAILGGNLASQLACTSGVHQLGSTYRLSPVSTNLVTTARKAISLCFSMWWFGNGWNAQLMLGAALVFIGSMIYTATSGDPPR